jgi:hypothetical protein
MLTWYSRQRVGSGVGPNANDKGLGLAAAMVDRPERSGSH